MSEIRVIAERTINAPATKVYSYIAEYRQHHPHILPPAFSDFNCRLYADELERLDHYAERQEAAANES